MTHNPIVWPESDRSEIDTISDGVIDATGAFCRVFWHWDDQSPHLLSLWAQRGGQRASQGITVSTLRQWVKNEHLGLSPIQIDGTRIRMATKYLKVMLDQVDWFNGGQVGPAPHGMEIS